MSQCNYCMGWIKDGVCGCTDRNLTTKTAHRAESGSLSSDWVAPLEAAPMKTPELETDAMARLAASACSACGVAWTDHLGIAGTCKKLEEARGALKVICTWASFRGGECLTPKDTEKLCRKALEASKPNVRMSDGANVD